MCVCIQTFIRGSMLSIFLLDSTCTACIDFNINTISSRISYSIKYTHVEFPSIFMLVSSTRQIFFVFFLFCSCMDEMIGERTIFDPLWSFLFTLAGLSAGTNLLIYYGPGHNELFFMSNFFFFLLFPAPYWPEND